MYCPGCGTYNDGSFKFCMKCGRNLTALNFENSQSSPKGSFRSTETEKYSSTPVLDEVKRLAASPIAIITALVFVAMIIMSIYSVNSDEMYITEMLDTEITNVSEYLPYLMFILYTIQNIIYAVGFWITVICAFDRKKYTSVTGLNLIKNVTNVLLIICYIELAFVAVVCIFSVSNSSDTPFYLNALKSLLTFVVSGGIIVYDIIYLRKICELVECFKYVIENETPVPASNFVATTSFIISALFMLLILLVPWSIFSVIYLLATISYIGFGALIISFNKSMRTLVQQMFVTDDK